MKMNTLNVIPLEAQYLFRKALALIMNGRHEDALECLRQAVVIAPNYSNALYEMGVCHDSLGHHCEAMRKFEAVLRIDPDHAEARSRHDQLREKLRIERVAGDNFFRYPVPELRIEGRTFAELVQYARRVPV